MIRKNYENTADPVLDHKVRSYSSPGLMCDMLDCHQEIVDSWRAIDIGCVGRGERYDPNKPCCMAVLGEGMWFLLTAATNDLVIYSALSPFLSVRLPTWVLGILGYRWTLERLTLDLQSKLSISLSFTKPRLPD